MRTAPISISLATLIAAVLLTAAAHGQQQYGGVDTQRMIGMIGTIDDLSREELQLRGEDLAVTEGIRQVLEDEYIRNAQEAPTILHTPVVGAAPAPGPSSPTPASLAAAWPSLLVEPVIGHTLGSQNSSYDIHTPVIGQTTY